MPLVNDTGAVVNDTRWQVNDQSSTTGPTAPAAPANLTATAMSANQVDLAWDGDPATESTNVERRPPGGTWVEIAFGVIGDTYTDPTVSPETTYEYQARSYADGLFSAYSNVAAVTTGAVPVVAPFDLGPETFAEVVADGHEVVARVDAMLNGAIKVPNLPVIAGRSEEDGSARHRARMTATILDEDGKLLPLTTSDLLSPYGVELVLRRGALVNGQAEYHTRGVFPIRSSAWQWSPDGRTVSVSGQDRSRRVADASLERITQFAKGTNLGVVIESLIRTAMPEVVTNFASVTATAGELIVLEEGSNPWEHAQDFAESIGMELFFDHDGICVLQVVPDVRPDFPPAARYTTGPTGNVTEIGADMDAEDAPNRYVVTSLGLAGDPVRGVWADRNPASPTHYGGPFGKRTKPVQSEKVSTTGQAMTMARALGTSQRGGTERTRVTTWPDPRRRIGEAVQVAASEVNFARMDITDRITMPLEVDGDMVLVTRAAYSAVEEDQQQ
jgi:hypothetical protein